MLGLDLAVDSKTGKTHSDSHAYVKKIDLKKKIDKNNIEYKNDLIQVTGNKDEKVLTTPHFKTSIDAINYFTEIIREESQKIINFSDGAKFVGVKPMEFQDFNISENLDAKKELKKIFSKFIINSLKEDEMKQLRVKLDDAKYIRKRLYEYQGEEYVGVEDYKKALLNLVRDMSSSSDDDIVRVAQNYFRYLLPYIFEFFNHKGVEVSRSDLEAIDDIFIKHLLSLC